MGKLDKFKTLWKLGPSNLARVGLYRLGIRFGIHPVLRCAMDEPVTGVFFESPPQNAPNGRIPRTDWAKGEHKQFGRVLKAKTDGPPEWHRGTHGSIAALKDTPWWKISDFDSNVGDIKVVWEPSRFDWILPLAQRAAAGDQGELLRLNDWLTDWCQHNRPYMGANWKCGQEASIRVMHLSVALILLGQAKNPSEPIKSLVRQHLIRIAPTINYAIGQANNHGTSEAVALFVGGSLLGDKQGAGWSRIGRKWLENRARKLITKDGTFSQYSVTYHRVMLDSYSLAEVWRRHLDLPEFSAQLVNRLQAATHWLSQMTDPETGDTPVLGANDGAHLIPLTQGGYRDFRPSVQLATALFFDQRAFQNGPWDQQLLWLGVEPPERQIDPNTSISFDDGGFHILRKADAVAYMRYPRFKFRPSQADALHVDLWVNHINILQDAGTYSYNTSPEDTAYFNGTAAHNTIEFDGRDQMPRLGRFLFGSWLSSFGVKTVPGDDPHAIAAYQDTWGATHKRKLQLFEKSLKIEDDIKGFKVKAVLRWKLAPLDWKLVGNTLKCDDFELNVTSDARIEKITLGAGYASRYYLEKAQLPVLEVTLLSEGKVTTEVKF